MSLDSAASPLSPEGSSHDQQTQEALLREKFHVIEVDVSVGNSRLRFLRPRSADELLDEEAFNRDERIPYWAEIWPSARVLAERLEGSLGEGKSCLELGCGVGLPAIVAARGGYQTLASDYYPEALQFVRLNALRNGTENLAVRMIDWRDWPQDLPRFDLVLASDVLYERPYAELMAEVLERSLAPGGKALVTDPGRRTAETFLRECERRKLQAKKIDVVSFPGEKVAVSIDLYEVLPSE